MPHAVWWVLLLVSACTSAPAPRPMLLDPLLPVFDMGPAAAELLGELRRDLAAGARAHAEATAATFAAELASALLRGDGEQRARLAALLTDEPTALARWGARDGEAALVALTRMRQLLADGHLSAALAAGDEAVVAAGAGPLVGVARVWRGFAAAAAGEAGRTAELAAAAESMAPFGPLAVARAHLVRCTADGDAGAWQLAVIIAGRATSARPELADPWLWRRALEMQPAGAEWPVEVVAALREATLDLRELRDDRAPNHAVVWHALAAQHRRRGESLAALSGYRRAEELAIAPIAKALAQVGQARALLALGRSGDARAVLDARLRAEAEPATAAAVAMLAAIELAEGQPAVARQLLTKALAMAGDDSWPPRGDALANLGISACLLGNVDAGHVALLQARDEFVRSGDREGLETCLDNLELCAREHQRGDLREVLELRERLRQRGSLTP